MDDSMFAKPPRELTDSDVIYDWNVEGRSGRLFDHAIAFVDETLRDGVQGPSVVDPKIEDKLAIVHLLDAIGVEYLDVGLPGAGRRAQEDVEAVVREIRDCKLAIQPTCAARTHIADIQPVVDISQRLGVAIEVMAFIGSSPIRLYAEGWNLDFMLERSAAAVDFTVQHGLPCTYVTEDTTRSRPEVLEALFKNAVAHGANRLCLCDTVGHATPDGIRNLIAFTRKVVAGLGGKVGIDWHGHNDRGLAVTNTIVALEAGADRAHGTMLGIGERVGNASLDQVLMNLKLLGELPNHDLHRLIELCHLTAQATQMRIPNNYPLVGADAFRTATGVHAAAIIKAEKKGDAFLADRIYSGVPAGLFGREQEIEIGHMSGESNVVYWLGRRGIAPEPELVKAILAAAKAGDQMLTEDIIFQVVKEHRAASRGSESSVKNA